MNKLNIFTNAFNTHSCLNSPPKKFNWVFNQYPQNDLPVVYFDDFIYTYVNDNYSGPKYGWLGESSEIIHHLIAAIERDIFTFKKCYKKIFTNDRRLIEKDPEFFNYNPPASNCPWVTEFNVFQKTKICSFITSFKSYTSGHAKRNIVFNELKDNSLFKNHIYGRDFNPIKNKLDGLKDYMFSLAFENAIYPKYYTEKITDCFASGTVPIYYGDRSIYEDFDKDGIIFFEDLNSFNDLTEERYINMLPAIKNNFNKVIKLKTSDDILYESVINDKIKHT